MIIDVMMTLMRFVFVFNFEKQNKIFKKQQQTQYMALIDE